MSKTDMVSLLNIGPGYIGPWGFLPQQSMVRRGIDVAARAAITVAGKAVLQPRSDDLSTSGASSGVGRIRERRCNAGICGLVGHQVLQLAERPAAKRSLAFLPRPTPRVSSEGFL